MRNKRKQKQNTVHVRILRLKFNIGTNKICHTVPENYFIASWFQTVLCTQIWMGVWMNDRSSPNKIYSHAFVHLNLASFLPECARWPKFLVMQLYILSITSYYLYFHEKSWLYKALIKRKKNRFYANRNFPKETEQIKRIVASGALLERWPWCSLAKFLLQLHIEFSGGKIWTKITFKHIFYCLHSRKLRS